MALTGWTAIANSVLYIPSKRNQGRRVAFHVRAIEELAISDPRIDRIVSGTP